MNQVEVKDVLKAHVKKNLKDLFELLDKVTYYDNGFSQFTPIGELGISVVFKAVYYKNSSIGRSKVDSFCESLGEEELDRLVNTFDGELYMAEKKAIDKLVYLSDLMQEKDVNKGMLDVLFSSIPTSPSAVFFFLNNTFSTTLHGLQELQKIIFELDDKSQRLIKSNFEELYLRPFNLFLEVNTAYKYLVIHSSSGSLNLKKNYDELDIRVFNFFRSSFSRSTLIKPL